ncbi:MAG: hypothetical protein IJL54_04230 [Prevotella sp.]|nr:hypothetical protein [Prevotella sp.]
MNIKPKVSSESNVSKENDEDVSIKSFSPVVKKKSNHLKLIIAVLSCLLLIVVVGLFFLKDTYKEDLQRPQPMMQKPIIREHHKATSIDTIKRDSNVPRSDSYIFYKVDKYQRIENFINKGTYDCNCYLTISTIRPDFNNYQNEVKFLICRRRRGKTKAHEVFKIFNPNNEFQMNFERGTRFEIDFVDKKDKCVRLNEL